MEVIDSGWNNATNNSGGLMGNILIEGLALVMVEVIGQGTMP